MQFLDQAAAAPAFTVRVAVACADAGSFGGRRWPGAARGTTQTTACTGSPQARHYSQQLGLDRRGHAGRATLTTEQLVKSNPRGSAILAWLPQARAEQIRRLQVHAQNCDGLVFLFRPEAVQTDASAAPLRILAALGQDWNLHLHILKRKGGGVDGILAIQSIPGALGQVLPARLTRPSQLQALHGKTEGANVNAHAHPLGRAADRRRANQLAWH